MQIRSTHAAMTINLITDRLDNEMDEKPEYYKKLTDSKKLLKEENRKLFTDLLIKFPPE
jgi:hypothetical protein